MTTTHTKTPWRRDGHALFDSRGYRLCRFHGVKPSANERRFNDHLTSDEDAANAAFAALAVNTYDELVAVCEEMRSIIGGWLGCCDEAEKAEAALAKVGKDKT
jgi:hypothetical protein